MKENSAHGFTEGSEVPKEQDAVHSQMADLEFLREYAKCGIHHNHAHNESNLKHKLQTLDAAISELTRLRSELQDTKDYYEKAQKHLIDEHFSELQQKDEVIKALVKGTELYTHLKFDDQPFTPYQLALQEIESLKAKLNN